MYRLKAQLKTNMTVELCHALGGIFHVFGVWEYHGVLPDRPMVEQFSCVFDWCSAGDQITGPVMLLTLPAFCPKNKVR